MRKYEKLASFIINNIGGKDNIVNITHCMTRLRIKLKDNDKVNIEELESNNNIISCQKAEGKLQVIIGTQVGEVYEEIIKQIGKVKTNEGTSQEGNSLINRFAATITKIVVPALGVLCACGIIAGLNSVLIATGMIESGSGTNILLNAMGNACLTFFPVILGYTSAVAFGMNPFVGMILGAVLIFPNISTDMNSGKVMFSIFANSPFKMDVFKTFFGLPIIFPATGYTSTLIPIMLINLCASKIEKFLDKQLPDVTKQFLAPFLTILIAGTVGVLVIGPISMIIQNGLQAGLSLLMDKSQILAFALITLIYQPLVIFGLHWPLITLGLMEFASTGSSLIVAAIFPASFTHMAACLAVFLRTKNIKMRNIAFPAFLSACFCIIEPSIYGVTLPVKKRFGFCMVGGLVGGLILALSNSPMFAISMGTTGIMSFVNPQGSGFAGLVWCVIACVAAMIITFVLTWITYRDEEDAGSEEDAKAIKKLNTKETIVAPMNGTIKPLDDMDDIAFANGSLGKGVCIVPNEGKVFSPCSGKVTVIFPTGHAIGIKSDDGAEILIHIGTDLYDKKELLFKKYVSQGDIVKRGQLLVSFDLNKMKEKKLNADTAVIVSNTNDYLDILLNNVTTVKVKDPIFTAVRAKSEFKEA
ncbi:glucose PTS transporter subunit IIA [Holdemanella biformis]|uniref:glucose PTS transporter subunit IIA n=1 Tax=Holdemanella biformis TaxID=1735 RepID=UPI003AB49EC4